MSDAAFSEAALNVAASDDSDGDAEMGRIPFVSVHAFCESPECASIIERAGVDRRMSRARLSVMSGGFPAALSRYQNGETPHLVIVETSAQKDALLRWVDALSQVCEANTRLIVIGRSNDIHLYRELTKRQVSEYLLAPVVPMQIIAAVGRVFRDPGSQQLGRVFAFIGAKGGVGSSTAAQNVAWQIGAKLKSEVLLVDLDMAFGSAALNFDEDPVDGVTDALSQPERLDDVLLERLLIKCDDYLNLLAAPASLDRTCDFDQTALDALLDVARVSFPYIVLDIPHQWTAWSRTALFCADEVVVTATPDLPNLVNAKRLIETVRRLRPLDAAPKLVLNHVGMTKRPEIKAKNFIEALQTERVISILSDPATFGGAANVGLVVSDMAPNSKAAGAFGELAQMLTGRKPRVPGAFGSLLGLFRRRVAKPAKAERQNAA